MNRYNGDGNDVMCKNSPQDITVDCTIRIYDVHDVNHDTGRSGNELTTNHTYDIVVNYVVIDIV